MKAQHLEFNTDEQTRLRVLRDYKILDTESEQAFDDLTYLASTACRTPISLITLIDKDRQWFKSHRGTSLQQTPLDTSLCAHVVRDRSPLIVPDTANDPRFRDMSLTKDAPFMRFYAGVPLFSTEGVAIGALCVIDLEPRLLTSEQMQTLQALSRQVMAQMELRRGKFKFQDQQASLIHKTKLASLGEMAASIAHEINNPLTIINGNVGLLRRILVHAQDLNHPKANQYLDSIEKTVHRIDKIIRGLKAMSRDGFNDPFEMVDLAGTIINANSLMREKFRYHGIEIRENVPTRGAWLECRSVQVEQIIINLLSNAFDAIRDLPEKWVDISIFDDGLNWVIRITDSGAGIPEGMQNKIMQPFFTTKQLYQGTGLGLSISKAIAEDHGGSLELDPIAKNTCFVLTLPKNQKIRKTNS